jgi:signal transduction histidine kinase
LLPVCVLGVLVPVVLAEPYVHWQRGRTFAIITAGYAGCVLALAALARFHNISPLGAHTPRWIENAFSIPVLVFLAVDLMVIVWNNAAALRTSRVRLVTAADEERRRLERDLHDGAQQHLVALAVLIQLARTAGHDRYQPLLTEASGLLDTAIAEIRRLAHGIYPPCSSAAVWPRPCRRSPRAPRSP